MAVAPGNPITYAVTTTNNGLSFGDQTTTVQLPVGLSNVVVSGGGSYNATTGVVSFPAVVGQAPGAANAVFNTIRFLAPANAPELTATATVTPTVASNDQTLNNNSATAITTVGPATAQFADLQTTVTSNVATQNAGSPVVFTVTTVNNGAGAASSLSQRLLLPAGLTGVSITGSNGATTANYDPATGIVTFPAQASLASGATNTYTVTANAPGAEPFTATSVVTSATTDPTTSNNVSTVAVPVAPRVDVQVTLAGPTQVQPNTPVTYTVSALNNGPSTAMDVSYSVQIPTGLTGVTVSGDGTYNPTTGLVTFPAIAQQVAGAAGQVSNTISFTTSNFSYTATATALADGDVVPANNTSSVLTQVNTPPVAFAVVNTLQSPMGNTAGQQLLTSLAGSDSDPGVVVQYVITSLPAAAPNGVSPGLLYFNGVLATVGTVVTDPTKLTFDPASNFVGNAFFTFVAVDNQSGQSQQALYTIPVAQDNPSVYTTVVKGGSANPYQNNDIVASVIDPNGAKYSDAGTVKTANDGNGVGTASMPGTGPAGNPTNALPPGISFDPASGNFFVSNRMLLMAGNYPLRITTVDPSGGITTQDIILTIGAFPLPVELVEFTAKAVNSLDAVLNWRTASELNNDHFDVERSLNGQEFVKIAQVKGQGNTSAATNYAQTDAGIGAKVSGLVYYRLRQVDTDGTTSFSLVRTVAFAKLAAPAISVYPNPATTDTKLDLTQLPVGSYRVSVLDATGRVVIGTTLEAGLVHRLDLNALASGTYHVLVQGQNTGTLVNLTKRLTKE